MIYPRELLELKVTKYFCLIKRLIKGYWTYIYRDVAGFDMSYDEFKNCAENHGEKYIIIFVLIDLKREIEEDFVLVLRAKKRI